MKNRLKTHPKDLFQRIKTKVPVGQFVFFKMIVDSYFSSDNYRSTFVILPFNSMAVDIELKVT